MDLLDSSYWTVTVGGDDDSFWSPDGELFSFNGGYTLIFTATGAWANDYRPETITIAGYFGSIWVIRVKDTAGNVIGSAYPSGSAFSEEISLTFNGYDIDSITISAGV